jgi:hypothetical protein
VSPSKKRLTHTTAAGAAAPNHCLAPAPAAAALAAVAAAMPAVAAVRHSAMTARPRNNCLTPALAAVVAAVRPKAAGEVVAEAGLSALAKAAAQATEARKHKPLQQLAVPAVPAALVAAAPKPACSENVLLGGWPDKVGLAGCWPDKIPLAAARSRPAKIQKTDDIALARTRESAWVGAVPAVPCPQEAWPAWSPNVAQGWPHCRLLRCRELDLPGADRIRA